MVPVLFLVAIGLKFAFITDPLSPEKPTSGGILDAYLQQSLWNKIHPSALGLLTVIILIFSALYFNYLLNSRKMFSRSNLLAALSYILFTSIFAGLQRLHPGIIMLPLTILLYRLILSLYHTQQPKTVVVNIGLLVGTGTLLYHPYWWMLPFCVIGLAQMRPFRLNEWALLFLSFLVPAYILLAYEYLTNQWNPAAHWPVWNPINNWPPVDPWWVAAIVLSVIWVIAGLGQWQSSNRRALIQTRKNWYMLIIMGLFIFPSLFYPKGNVYEGLTLLLLPASAFGTFALSGESRRKLKVFFFWLLTIAGAVFSWAVIHGKMV